MNILSCKKANLTILYPVATTSTLVLINPDICAERWAKHRSIQVVNEESVSKSNSPLLFLIIRDDDNPILKLF
jgi:hypothetical protein